MVANPPQTNPQHRTDTVGGIISDPWAIRGVSVQEGVNAGRMLTLCCGRPGVKLPCGCAVAKTDL